MESQTIDKTALLPQVTEPRNPGMALDLDWVANVQANTSAIERRAASLPGRRSVKKDYQAAWLLKAITLIDLTTLSGDDTAGRVRRLCAKARQPVRTELLDALGVDGITTGAVCAGYSKTRRFPQLRCPTFWNGPKAIHCFSKSLQKQRKLAANEASWVRLTIPLLTRSVEKR